MDYYGSEPQYELSEEDFDFMVGVNQKGTFLVSQAVTRVLYGKKEGVIINLSSCAGLMGSRGHSCYSATKAAIHAFTISWAKELGPYNIPCRRCGTDILDRTPANNDEKYRAQAYGRGWDVNTRPEEFFKNYKSSIPLGRPGHLYEVVADLICYLISDHASYITGVTIPVSGVKKQGIETKGLDVTTCIRVPAVWRRPLSIRCFGFSIAWTIEKAICRKKQGSTC